MKERGGAALATECIGLMGGSFNPIHQRHIDMARCALNDCALRCVCFLPTGNPPHKNAELAPAEDRYEMTRLALMREDGMTASRIELDRRGVIYTYDTLLLLRRERPNAELCYIIGEDTLLQLPTWHKPDQVFAMCRFLVCSRDTRDASAQPLCAELAARGARFTFLSLPPKDVSATAIRQKLMLGEFPDELAPQVAEYIRLCGLYGVAPSPANGAALYAKLRNELGERRLLHSVLVAATARRLARRYGLDEGEAALAGLLHDCAKALPLDRLQAVARENRLPLDSQTMHSESLLHAPVSAVLAQREYGVTDPAVLSAIRCHTTGRVGMQPLDMVVFVADKIEPSRRDYPALAELRALAEYDLAAAVRCSLASTQEYIHEERGSLHPIAAQVSEWLARPRPAGDVSTATVPAEPDSRRERTE